MSATTHSNKTPRRARWERVGAARRVGDGIRIEIGSGPMAGTYAISAHDALALFVANEPAPLYQLSDISEPFKAGRATVSDSGRMVMLTPNGSGRYGALQIPGAHLAAHYLRHEREAVEVVSPPEPAPRPEPARDRIRPSPRTVLAVV